MHKYIVFSIKETGEVEASKPLTGRQILEIYESNPYVRNKAEETYVIPVQILKDFYKEQTSVPTYKPSHKN